ncbi:MAG: ribosome recycling factor [Clostridia bacterium]|nr:ribosome recycling factor [Clostridia bacterium]
MKFDTKAMENRAEKAIASFENTISTVRASQANAGVLSNVNFEYYGSPTPLSSMADIRVADARTLVITPYDATTLKAMEKAILMSDVGITPMNDGKVIRLSFPQLTEERRKEIKKQVQKYAEDAKVAIRNIRRDANEDAKKQKKDGDLTEDDLKNAEKAIQDVTDKYTKRVDEILAKKEKEIMAI